MTVKHGFGETVIEKKPERIVTLGWESDYLVALGIVPIIQGTQAYTAKGDNYPWFDDALKKLGKAAPPSDAANYGSEIDYEAILKAKPDLILTRVNGLDAGDDTQQKRLSQIAPTISIDSDMKWRDTTRYIAKIVDRQSAGETLIADIDKQLQKARKEYPAVQGLDFMRVDLSPEKVWLWDAKKKSD